MLIPIVITFSGMLISVSSIVAPFLSPDGHKCNSRRFCTLITWTEGVTLHMANFADVDTWLREQKRRSEVIPQCITCEVE